MKKNRTIDAEFFYGATPEIFHRAGELRKNMTISEKLLWNKLSARKTGFTFRRQHPINFFIADFYCHKAKLVVEVDGSIHEIESVKIRDKGRDDEFQKFGIKTIRFTNEFIKNYLEDAVKSILDECIIRTGSTISSHSG